MDGKVIAESITSMSVPYPREYTDLIVDKRKLERVATVTGGKMSPKVAKMMSADGEKIRYNKDLWAYLLFGVLALFFLDVLLRRVRIFGYAATPLETE
jgi:hypothetical protein